VYAQGDKRGQWRCGDDDPIGTVSLTASGRRISFQRGSFSMSHDSLVEISVEHPAFLPEDVTSLLRDFDAFSQAQEDGILPRAVGELLALTSGDNAQKNMIKIDTFALFAFPNAVGRDFNLEHVLPKNRKAIMDDDYARLSSGLHIEDGKMYSAPKGERVPFYLYDTSEGYLAIWPSSQVAPDFPKERNFKDMGFLFFTLFDCRKHVG
jgi:hypothetical protein